MLAAMRMAIVALVRANNKKFHRSCWFDGNMMPLIEVKKLII